MPGGWHNRSAKQAVENIGQYLNRYSAAAMAAGVSMLALAQPAQSEVIVTKKNLPITAYTPVTLDLNQDGIADFKFVWSGSNYDHSVKNSLNVEPLTGGQAVGTAGGSYGPYASALANGANIGPGGHFIAARNGKILLEHFYSFQSGIHSSKAQGKWDNLGPNRFLGVKFKIGGATHYGWVRITVSVTPYRGVAGTITAYAYETIANKKIEAGVSSDGAAAIQSNKKEDLEVNRGSLGMLAMGADGLELWRRENVR